MAENKKYKCPECGEMNEKDSAVNYKNRYYCQECYDKKTEGKEEKKPQEPKTRTVKRFDMHEEALVISLVKRGKLVFEDHEGIIYEWEEFKDENWMTIKALTHMRNRHKKFFTEPWVRVDDDVAEFLKIKVDDSVDIDNLDIFFNLNNEEFEDRLVATSNGIRNIIVDYAINKIETGELDSRQKIRILENICKVELVEKAVREFTKEVKEKK